MLLRNSDTDQSQRVSVVAAAEPSNDNLNEQSMNDQFLEAVTYTKLASVVKKCDCASHYSYAS